MSPAQYNTAGTVSAPLDLDAVRGEHEAVAVNGGKKVAPKPKVTLTSLTVNNVSVPSCAPRSDGIGCGRLRRGALRSG